MHQRCTWMVWLSLCKLHPILFQDHKTVRASHWRSGNKTSSTPNLNQQSVSTYSQPHVLRLPCHLLVKHTWSDDMDRFCNHWQIATVVEKAFHARPKNGRCMWTSLMPRPLPHEEKPGTDCLHMRKIFRYIFRKKLCGLPCLYVEEYTNQEYRVFFQLMQKVVSCLTILWT